MSTVCSYTDVLYCAHTIRTNNPNAHMEDDAVIWLETESLFATFRHDPLALVPW